MNIQDFQNIGILEYLYQKKITTEKDYIETKKKLMNKLNIKFKGEF